LAEIREFFFANSVFGSGHKIGVPEPLFPKLDVAVLGNLKKKHAGQENNNVVSSDIKFTKQPAVKWPCAIVHFKDLKLKRHTKEVDAWKAEALKEIDLKAIEAFPHVVAYNKFNQGLDQSKFVNSVLNLSNLLKNSKNGQLPNINVFVDIYNLFSLKYGIVGGAYDRAAIQGDLTYAVATGTEHFIPLGVTDAEKIQPGEWVLKDSKDRVMTKLVTKQASYSAITLSTKECVLCLQGNPYVTLQYLEDIAKELGDKITKSCGGSFSVIHLQ
jgi:DNA/RNA-binding domain of Phe-tRNA-synthetase-like protein